MKIYSITLYNGEISDKKPSPSFESSYTRFRLDDMQTEYITVAESYKIPARCIYMNTSMEESMARNNLREKPVPRIVYNIYNKKLEIPDATL